MCSSYITIASGPCKHAASHYVKLTQMTRQAGRTLFHGPVAFSVWPTAQTKHGDAGMLMIARYSKRSC